MKKIICPYCGKDGDKVISVGLPMKFCSHCSTLWGFWSYFHIWFVAPIEGFFSGGFSFMTYNTSYPKALWHWLFKKDDDAGK